MSAPPKNTPGAKDAKPPSSPSKTSSDPSKTAVSPPPVKRSEKPDGLNNSKSPPTKISNQERSATFAVTNAGSSNSSTEPSKQSINLSASVGRRPVKGFLSPPPARPPMNFNAPDPVEEPPKQSGSGGSLRERATTSSRLLPDSKAFTTATPSKSLIAPAISSEPNESKNELSCNRCESTSKGKYILCKDCSKTYCSECSDDLHAKGKWSQHTLAPSSGSSESSQPTPSSSSEAKVPAKTPAASFIGHRSRSIVMADGSSSSPPSSPSQVTNSAPASPLSRSTESVNDTSSPARPNRPVRPGETPSKATGPPAKAVERPRSVELPPRSAQSPPVKRDPSKLASNPPQKPAEAAPPTKGVETAKPADQPKSLDPPSKTTAESQPPQKAAPPTPKTVESTPTKAAEAPKSSDPPSKVVETQPPQKTAPQTPKPAEPTPPTKAAETPKSADQPKSPQPLSRSVETQPPQKTVTPTPKPAEPIPPTKAVETSKPTEQQKSSEPPSKAAETTPQPTKSAEPPTKATPKPVEDSKSVDRTISMRSLPKTTAVPPTKNAEPVSKPAIENLPSQKPDTPRFDLSKEETALVPQKEKMVDEAIELIMSASLNYMFNGIIVESNEPATRPTGGVTNSSMFKWQGGSTLCKYYFRLNQDQTQVEYAPASTLPPASVLNRPLPTPSFFISILDIADVESYAGDTSGLTMAIQFKPKPDVSTIPLNFKFKNRREYMYVFDGLRCLLGLEMQTPEMVLAISSICEMKALLSIHSTTDIAVPARPRNFNFVTV